MTFFIFGMNIIKYQYSLTPLCVACKYKQIFGVLEVLNRRKMDTDILACNYVRIYLHASLTYFPNDFRTKKIAKI